MNKKKIFIAVAILIIIIIPIIAVGANKIRRKMNGKTVVMQGDDISDIEDGEKLILSAPVEDENSGREEDLAIKRAYEENMYSENNIAKPSVEVYSAEESEEQKQYEKEQEELEDMVQAIIDGMYENYDKEYVDYVVERSEKTIGKDEETLLKEREELIDMIITSLEKGNITEESSNAIRKFLGLADLDFIQNENLKSRLRNLEIDI